jgi:SAM-dependent methyltransferase
MAQLEPYEQFYYGGQVDGRGLTTPSELEPYFKSVAFDYGEFFGARLDHLRDLPALDLGCGYGNFLYFLRQRNWAASHGVDLDQTQVALANALGLDARHGNALEAIGDNKLGLISAFDLIEHLSKNDAVALLLASQRALLPGGALIVQCPCADGFRGSYDLCNDLTHRWAPTSVSLRQMLITAGFDRVDLIDLTLPPYSATTKRRIKYAIRRLARKLAAPVLSILGINNPRIWSDSVMAIAWQKPA